MLTVAWKQAGAIAAFTVDMLIYPLDTLKTRIQAARGEPQKLALKGLYNGVGSVVAATLPSAALFFTTYEGAKSLISQHASVPMPVLHLASSSLAEMVSCGIIAPAEVIKQRAQVAEGAEARSLAIAKSILRETGLKGLGKGYLALVGRNLPFTAIQFPLYEYLRQRFRERWSLTVPSASAFGAAVAGSTAAWITTPIDVVKTRVMLGRAHTDRSLVQVAQDILRAEGVRGLFKGGGLRAAWTALGSGIYLGSFEWGKRWLQGRRMDEDVVGE